MKENTTIKVFISYTRGSKTLDSTVLKLSDKLNYSGIDCTIDQYQASVPYGWPKWMLDQLLAADYVLVVASKRYYQIFMNEIQEGKGVTFESTITLNEIYDLQMNNEKFIPIVFSHDDLKYIIPPLKPYQWYDLSVDAGYIQLLRRITKQPEITKPKMGQLPSFKTGINLTDDNDDAVADVKTQTKLSLFEVEIHLNKDAGEFTSQDESDLLMAIKLLAGLSDLKIKRRRTGSIFLTFEMSQGDMERLMTAYKSGLLGHLDIVDAQVMRKPFAENLVNLTVKEAEELAQILKEEYGIEPVLTAVDTNNKTGEEYYVNLTKTGSSPNVIVLTLKMLIGLGLKEVNAMVSTLPAVVFRTSERESAVNIKEMLQKGGASAEVVKKKQAD